MLLQKLIQSRPDWLEHLADHYKINIFRDGDLVSLKYNQFESPMSELLVRQCRGTVVHVPSGQVLAWPYNKFFNYGEHLADEIDWATARVQEKLDGSLMILFWNCFVEEWQVASSGHPAASGFFAPSGQASISEALGDKKETFRDAFWRIFASTGMRLPPAALHGCTFMFELCSHVNRVVVKHDQERIVLHGGRHRSGEEYSRQPLAAIADMCRWPIIQEYPISTIEECLAAADALDPVRNEGFVVVDARFRRVKIKSPRYVILHQLKGDATPRRVIELWQTGETSEVLAHFPELRSVVDPVHDKLEAAALHALDDVEQYGSLETRKEFAAVVKDRPWAAACFKFYGKPRPSLDQIRAEMRDYSTQALERLVEKMS